MRPGELYRRGYEVARRIHRRILGSPVPQKKKSTDLRRRIEIVDGARRAEFLAHLRDELGRRDIGFTEGGACLEWRPKVHVRASDRAEVVDAVQAATARLNRDAAHPGSVLVHLPDVGYATIEQLPDVLAEMPRPAVDLWIVEHDLDGAVQDPTEPEGVFTVVELDFWGLSELGFGDRPYFRAPRINSFATTMRPSEFDRIVGSGPHPRQARLEDGEQGRDLYDRDFPIDIVYTWVDGRDPEWARIRDHYRPARNVPSDDEATGHLDERFRNRDELKYSLRSIEMFAPFVRKIYLVTMDQCPEWLDTTNPRIEVVSHRDIYRHPDALPTFNSSSIETQLHHIEGLAEHFVYFNDDVLLGRPCSWSDFFLANGSTKFVAADHTIAASTIQPGSAEYALADKNAVDLLRRDFGYVVHRPMAHVPHASRRSVLEELEQRFPAEFEACERSRFRSQLDLRPIAFMAHHYGFATHRAVPGALAHRYLALWKPYIQRHLDRALRSRRYQALCLNDVGVGPEREASVAEMLHRFLEDYFPLPSAFEKKA